MHAAVLCVWAGKKYPVEEEGANEIVCMYFTRYLWLVQLLLLQKKEGGCLLEVFFVYLAIIPGSLTPSLSEEKKSLSSY